MTEQQKPPSLDELARQMAAAVPGNLKALGEDLERNFKAMLHSGFERMDLVTREEFELQSALLERSCEKLEKLEARLAELEKERAAD